ncbi:Arc family DNA-binding protein [Shinella sp. S4-D37]|uniref:Arc family DNA-binding protein n=1 Tax=Shinella sp. S4-D37 TaxID=3161999 RepID=UPI00346746D7
MTDPSEEVRFTLRLPAALRDRLIHKGKENGRSLNAEIVSRLERAIIEEDSFDKSIYDFTGELEERLEKLERMVWDHDERLLRAKV